MIGLVALGGILGISGPFNTLDTLPAVPRILYWVVVVAVTFAAGSGVSSVVHSALGRRQPWLCHTVSIAAIGLTVTAALSLLNLAAFGLWFENWTVLLSRLGMVTLISAVVELSSLALRAELPAELRAEGRGTRAAILDRLPFDKRGEIVALSAEDHYVRIVTTKGAALVLMRLSDAVKEVGDTAGLQIHRSHWVAVHQVKDVKRAGDRAEVLSSDGTNRPISRSFIPAAQKAGLLPAK
ncbi:LytTR family DNA-binding domain-containing protein [Pseudorhodobacter ferrugineus]|uniref:LytTR family DNA-binding domain-containing protein n=1 Tax=Pseudorhodobacter ferrugineus TaxID=77008 RepID=UPI0003B67A26|nr:LytTR family DNA-binding domain-containing protein [Pseudorhodobacter ferrugineus]